MNLIGRTINNRYRISEKIGEDFLSFNWKAQRLPSNDEVLFRSLKHDNMAYRVEDLIRLKKDTAMVSRIEHPNVAKIFEIDSFADQNNNLQAKSDAESYTYIATEFNEGMDLANYFINGGIFEQDETLRLIQEIIEALKIVHQNGIIHRDLSPENILVVSKNGHFDLVKVSGFGFVELKELTEIHKPEDIINTFSYMSPEACGIVNKSVDERSDLYSLGIIFYQLLAGELPFKGDNVNTILHQHIAMALPPLSEINNNISHDLDRVVLKLLSKDQEERYQTATGLLTDIEKIRSGERDFELGTEDIRHRLNFKSGLVGREDELNTLKELFNRTFNSTGSICLIAGEAGSGKTRLVDELRAYIFDKDGIFISGKCFVSENKTPYQIFIEALNDYIIFYNRLDDEDQEKTGKMIRTVMGDLGEIALDLNPAMKEILGEVKPLVKLEPDQENERFLNLSSDLLCSLGKMETPVVLFLDDLQWADEGSLLLLWEIAYKIKKYPLFVIGTYRHNEISGDHKLNKIKDDFPDTTIINTNLFNAAKLNNLSANITGIKDSALPCEFTDFILDKSKGNPFFAIEMIRQLVDDKVIFLKENNWEIDTEKLVEEEIPGTIVGIEFIFMIIYTKFAGQQRAVFIMQLCMIAVLIE